MKISHVVVATILVLPMGWARAGTEGSYSTFYGNQAGASNSTDTNENTFIGSQAGYVNSTGQSNTFVGRAAGFYNSSGSYNTFLGGLAGYYHDTGSGNVFLGYQAGLSEMGSNRLYIDNCYSGGSCTSPLIYGEFDNRLLKVNGVVNVAADSVTKSQMHFSLDNGDYGGFLTSVLQNNFFVSSGARYSGGWIQRSADTNAVIAGSGGVGYRIFTHTGSAVGATFTPTVRLHIDYSGQFGINTAPVAGHEIHTAAGAYEAGGSWVNGSSRELKENIRQLSTDEASQALAALDPVKFNYKTDRDWQHVGFIAEDVPDLVASPDRKGLSPMDIVAVLTKVVQEQKQALDEKSRALDEVKDQMALLLSRIQRLETLNSTAQR